MYLNFTTRAHIEIILCSQSALNVKFGDISIYMHYIMHLKVLCLINVYDLNLYNIILQHLRS